MLPLPAFRMICLFLHANEDLSSFNQRSFVQTNHRAPALVPPFIVTGQVRSPPLAIFPPASCCSEPLPSVRAPKTAFFFPADLSSFPSQSRLTVSFTFFFGYFTSDLYPKSLDFSSRTKVRFFVPFCVVEFC